MISAIVHNKMPKKGHCKNQCPVEKILKKAFFNKNASFQSYSYFLFIQYLVDHFVTVEAPLYGMTHCTHVPQVLGESGDKDWDISE